MTPEERAEKIVTQYWQVTDPFRNERIAWIAAEIADACRAAVDESMQRFIVEAMDSDPRLAHAKRGVACSDIGAAIRVRAREVARKSCRHPSTYFDRMIFKCSDSCDERMHEVCRDCGETICEPQEAGKTVKVKARFIGKAKPLPYPEDGYRKEIWNEAIEKAAILAHRYQERRNSHRFLAQHIAKKIRALKIGDEV